jgi:membrane protein DedA with SNARE-associated domain
MLTGELYSNFFNLVTNFVSTYSYFGVFVLSFLETLFAPLPSEIVLPFAGYIAWKNNDVLFLFISIIVGAIGNTIGSIPLYYLGFLGRNFVEKYGKYFFINKKRLNFAEKWFEKNKFLTVFFFRFVPGMRSLISIPAGLFRLKIKDYMILTFLGFLIWNSFLVSLGYVFGNYWQESLRYASQIEFFGLIFFIAIVIYLLLKYLL